MKAIYKAKLRRIQELDNIMRHDCSPYFELSDDKGRTTNVPIIDKHQASRVRNWL